MTELNHLGTIHLQTNSTTLSLISTSSERRCSHNGIDLTPHYDRPVQLRCNQHRLDLSPYAEASPASYHHAAVQPAQRAEEQPAQYGSAIT